MTGFAQTFSLWVLTTAAALAAALTLPLGAAARDGALTGALIASAAGLAALVFKKRALGAGGEGQKAIAAGLKAVGLGMAVKMLALGVGLWLSLRAGHDAVAFTCGFFGVYLFQQLAEARWVLARSSQVSGGATR